MPEQEDKERIAALEVALHALVANDPVLEGDVAYYCSFCHGEQEFGTLAPPLIHATDCPWVKARELLGLKGEE